jgi:hypothetical protein
MDDDNFRVLKMSAVAVPYVEMYIVFSTNSVSSFSAKGSHIHSTHGAVLWVIVVNPVPVAAAAALYQYGSLHAAAAHLVLSSCFHGIVS